MEKTYSQKLNLANEIQKKIHHLIYIEQHEPCPDEDTLNFLQEEKAKWSEFGDALYPMVLEERRSSN